MNKLKPRAVIFDLGCTLIEYEALSWDELAKHAVANGYALLRKKNIELPPYPEFYNRYTPIRDKFRAQAREQLTEWTIQDAARMLLKEIGVKASADDIEEFFDAYYEPVAEQLYIYDDTVETLENLRDRISTIGLISNTIFPERTHRAELQRFGIDHFFDFEIYSSSFGLRKPHPDIFYHAANQAGAGPSECVYIGDRYPEDILGPTRIGMSAILKRRDGREYPAERTEPFAEITRLSELIDLLEN